MLSPAKQDKTKLCEAKSEVATQKFEQSRVNLWSPKSRVGGRLSTNKKGLQSRTELRFFKARVNQEFKPASIRIACLYFDKEY